MTSIALRLAAAALVAASIAYDLSIVFIVPVLFILIVPFEKMFPRHRGQRVRRPLMLLDVRWALTTALSSVAAIAVGIVIGVLSLSWVPGLALRPLVTLLPGWLLPFVGIALFDIAIYWAHRWSHEVPVLWRFHSVHHSTEQLDWISGFRAHPLDGAIVAPVALFLIAAGFDNTFTGALAVVQFLTGLFLHANVRWRLRPLHRLVITPEFHHWHHSYEPEAHSSNYSVFLPLWDILFGTYYMPRNKRPVRYGVADPVPTTMRGQLVYPFRGLRPIRRTIRTIVRDTWRSTTRERTRYARPGEPYPWTSITP
jgi:sterol desaturase/sphingolipid hydroxylase (fatty acid hydroxylase superfamily)